MTIGEKICCLRKKYGLSQEQVAQMTGCTRQYICKVEKGGVKAPRTVVKALLPELKPNDQLLLEAALRRALKDQED